MADNQELFLIKVQTEGTEESIGELERFKKTLASLDKIKFDSTKKDLAEQAKTLSRNADEFRKKFQSVTKSQGKEQQDITKSNHALAKTYREVIKQLDIVKQKLVALSNLRKQMLKASRNTAREQIEMGVVNTAKQRATKTDAGVIEDDMGLGTEPPSFINKGKQQGNLWVDQVGEIAFVRQETDKLISRTEVYKNGLLQVSEIWERINQETGKVERIKVVGGADGQTGVVQKITATNKKPNSFLNTFLDKFGRVGLYRLIRGMIQMVEQAVQQLIKTIGEGIKMFAKFDSTTKQAFSNMTSSFTIMKQSLGSLFAPMVEAFAPAMRSIAVAMGEFANGIREAQARMKGLATYSKINTEYLKTAKDLVNSTGAKFDTFNTLSGADEESGSIVQGEVSQDAENIDYFMRDWITLSKSLNSVWETLQETFSALWMVLKPIVDILMIAIEVVMDVVDAILEALNPSLEEIGRMFENIWIVIRPFIVNLKNFIKSVLPGFATFIGGIVKVVMSVVGFVVNIISGIVGLFTAEGEELKKVWTDVCKSFVNIFIGVGNILFSAVVTLAQWFVLPILQSAKMIWNFLSKIINFFAGTSFSGSDLDGAIESVKGWSESAKIPYLADGGSVSAGTLFVAGERGTEMVWNNTSGGSSVANIDQIRQAQYESLMQAIADSGLIYTIESSGSFDIYMDAEKVGNSVGKTSSLRNQLNRTNVGLNIR